MSTWICTSPKSNASSPLSDRVEPEGGPWLAARRPKRLSSSMLTMLAM